MSDRYIVVLGIVFTVVLAAAFNAGDSYRLAKDAQSIQALRARAEHAEAAEAQQAANNATCLGDFCVPEGWSVFGVTVDSYAKKVVGNCDKKPNKWLSPPNVVHGQIAPDSSDLRQKEPLAGEMVHTKHGICYFDGSKWLDEKANDCPDATQYIIPSDQVHIEK